MVFVQMFKCNDVIFGQCDLIVEQMQLFGDQFVVDWMVFCYEDVCSIGCFSGCGGGKCVYCCVGGLYGFGLWEGVFVCLYESVLVQWIDVQCVVWFCIVCF